YTLPADFGDHLTVRFFQGPPDLVSKAMDHLIATRRPGVIIPHPDGFYIDPAGREGNNKVNYAQVIFDNKLNTTIGVLVLGAAKDFQVIGPEVAAPQNLTFVALAPPDSRHIRN